MSACSTICRKAASAFPAIGPGANSVANCVSPPGLTHAQMPHQASESAWGGALATNIPCSARTLGPHKCRHSSLRLNARAGGGMPESAHAPLGPTTVNGATATATATAAANANADATTTFTIHVARL